MYEFQIVNFQSSKDINNNNNNNQLNTFLKTGTINNNTNNSEIDEPSRKYSNLNNNNNSSNNNNIIDSKIIEQFSHQVGGHSCILSLDEKICKPLIEREYQFYQYLSSSISTSNNLQNALNLSLFIANYYGVVEVLKLDSKKNNNSNINNENNNQSPSLISSNNSLPTTSNNTIISTSSSSSSLSSSTSTTKSSKELKKILSKHPIGTKKRYIVLEDLTKGYNKPCIVDIKVGTRQKGVICSSTTSTSLGIRVCGMKIFKPDIGTIVYDRFYGRSLNPKTLESSLFQYFNNNRNDQYPSQINLVENIINKLKNIKNIISNSDEPFPFKIYSSSLLIVYEGDVLGTSTNSNSISSSSSILDVHHQLGSSSLSSSSSSSTNTTPSSSPSNSFVNSSPSNRQINFSNDESDDSSSSSTTSFVDDEDSVNEDDEDVDVSCVLSDDLDSDLDDNCSSTCSSDSLEGRKTTPSRNSRKLSSTPSTTTLKSSKTTFTSEIKHDVKMIDFAHAIPSNEQDATDDDGYLFGIENLIKILINVRDQLELEQQQNHLNSLLLQSSSSSLISDSALIGSESDYLHHHHHYHHFLEQIQINQNILLSTTSSSSSL
eukprot:gene2060-2540_t